MPRRSVLLAATLLVVACRATDAAPSPSAHRGDPEGARELPSATELTGTEWVLDTVVVGDVAAAPVGAAATLVLRSDGTLNGGTGCRSFDGTWGEEGGQIVATRLTMTDEACAPETHAQDAQVVSVIGDGFVATVEGRLLTVSDPGGIGLVYRAAE